MNEPHLRAVFYPAVRCGGCGHEGIGVSADDWHRALRTGDTGAWFDAECHQCGWTGSRKLWVEYAKPFIIHVPKETPE